MNKKINHISSLVVLCKSNRIDSCVQSIEQSADAEVYATDPDGKIIVVLETPNEQAILDGINRITALSGVISANMVYHQID